MGDMGVPMGREHQQAKWDVVGFDPEYKVPVGRVGEYVAQRIQYYSAYGLCLVYALHGYLGKGVHAPGYGGNGSVFEF
jgi:hypothetical protein